MLKGVFLWFIDGFRAWPEMNGSVIKADIIAGFISALVAFPQGIAFAAIAGMPVEYGIYTCMVPAILAALLGSSWHLVSGPTTAASALLLSSLSHMAEPASMEYVSLAITVTFLVGIMQIFLGLARLGILIEFVSHSVITGFTAAAACTIIFKQLELIFVSSSPLQQWHIVDIEHWMAGMDFAMLSTGAVTVVVSFLAMRYWRQIPWIVPALFVGSGFYLLGLKLNIFPSHAAGMVGALDLGFPPLAIPDLSPDTLHLLFAPALAMTVLAVTESVSIGQSIATKTGQQIDGGRELIAQGVGNLGGSFTSAYVSTGSFNRSALNFQSGARSPLAAVIAGFLLLLFASSLAQVGQYLSTATLAAVLLVVAIKLIDFGHIVHLIKHSHSEFLVAALTLTGSLIFGLDSGLLAGVGLSLFIYLRRTARPTVEFRIPKMEAGSRRLLKGEHNELCPQIVFVHIDGAFYFGSSRYIANILRSVKEQFPDLKHLAVMAQGVSFIDLSGADLLANESRIWKQKGGKLYLYRPKQNLLDTMSDYGRGDAFDETNIYYSKNTLIKDLTSSLSMDICKKCTKKAFVECNLLTQGKLP